MIEAIEDQAIDTPLNTCCICGTQFYGFGNNPEPVVDAGDGTIVCCDPCNYRVVIPKRLEAMRRYLDKSERGEI